VEGLIRWQHPEFGLILPMHFIPVAESCGLIVPIGRWVLREACMQALAWQKANLELPHVAVNISATEMHNDGFTNGVREVLAETGLPGRFLEMEITERVLMDQPEEALLILRELREMGINITINALGVRYSSLSYLRRFAVDILKIDRSFIQELGSKSNDSAIVTALITMAKSLNLLVVAEGIETEAQKNCLEVLHCPEGQGYFFGRPVLPEQIAHRLKQTD
jgi:EAL domain-containing protein (putative c-di-GMP-specific phosphodiesterase class I)